MIIQSEKTNIKKRKTLWCIPLLLFRQKFRKERREEEPCTLTTLSLDEFYKPDIVEKSVTLLAVRLDFPIILCYRKFRNLLSYIWTRRELSFIWTYWETSRQ